MGILGKRKKVAEVNLWEMFDSNKDINRAAATWKAKTFLTLLRSEGTHDVKLEDVDGAQGAVYLSLGGPRYEGDREGARVSFEWRKDDDSIEQAEKGEIMRVLTDTYRKDLPERRSRVTRAGKIIGYRVFI